MFFFDTLPLPINLHPCLPTPPRAHPAVAESASWNHHLISPTHLHPLTPLSTPPRAHPALAESAARHLKRLEALRKLFLTAGSLASAQRQLLHAHDELGMALVRLSAVGEEEAAGGQVRGRPGEGGEGEEAAAGQVRGRPMRGREGGRGRLQD